jgi:hypothetical protein
MEFEITEELIRQLVVEVVEKLEAMRAGQVKAPTFAIKRANAETFDGKVLSAWDVESAFRNKAEILLVRSNTIITPLAEERCRDLGVRLEYS